MYGWCSRQVRPRRLNQLAPEMVSTSPRGFVSIASTRIRCCGASAASENRVYLMIDERGAEQPTRLHLCVGTLVRECTSQPWFSFFVRRTERFHLPLPRSEPCSMAEKRT